MKRKYLDLVFTNHAISRLYNRGITQEKAYETFKNPNGQLAGKIPGSTKFYKNYGKQRVEVIVKKMKKVNGSFFLAGQNSKKKLLI